MKKVLLLALCVVLWQTLEAQKISKERLPITVEAGFGIFNHRRMEVINMDLNLDDLDNTDLNLDVFMDMNYPTQGGKIYGQGNIKAFNLKFTTETRYRNLDLIFGAMALIGERYNQFSIGTYEKDGYQYLMNGGGVYAGISPKWKTKYFGLTSDFAVGIFPIKEYASAVLADEAHPNFTNVNQNKASVFGAMASVGFYVNVWRIGINPTFNVLYAGGAGAGFFLYGFMLPLTITF